MSLKIVNARICDAVLHGVPAGGPPSLRSRWSRLRYHSPEGLGAAFDEALKVVSQESANLRSQAAKLNGADREKLLARAERHNPEVKFNHIVQSAAVDLSEPVYKMLAERDWRHKPMLILMQRIEQHGVIADTLPTLDPQAAVELKFVTPHMRAIEPGEFLANDVCMRQPRVSIRDFGVAAGEQAQYTVLIVNPDVPDLERDRFSTYLHFAATNVPASLAQPLADFSKAHIAASYIPPHPEKNAGPQRLCVWVLRQSKPVTSEVKREAFDIREFVAANELLPVGASLWRAKWDLSSPMVREKYGLPKGRVYFRARTARPEEALLHLRERPKWQKIDEEFSRTD